MAVVVVVAVAMVRVPMPAQDDKDERIDQDPHQRQDEHYCTPKSITPCPATMHLWQTEAGVY